MATFKNITASQILANYRKSPDTDLVIERLNKVERRKREDEDARQGAINSIASALNRGAFAEKKFKIAEIGGFEGTFWDFMSKPEIAQGRFEVGLKKVQADPSLLGDNWIDKLGTGLRNLLNPSSIAQPTQPDIPGINLLDKEIL